MHLFWSWLWRFRSRYRRARCVGACARLVARKFIHSAGASKVKPTSLLFSLIRETDTIIVVFFFLSYYIDEKSCTSRTYIYFFKRGA